MFFYTTYIKFLHRKNSFPEFFSNPLEFLQSDRRKKVTITTRVTRSSVWGGKLSVYLKLTFNLFLYTDLVHFEFYTMSSTRQTGLRFGLMRDRSTFTVILFRNRSGENGIFLQGPLLGSTKIEIPFRYLEQYIVAIWCFLRGDSRKHRNLK